MNGIVSRSKRPSSVARAASYLPGLSNAGHEYGTTLGAAEKEALLEYLKTL